MSKRPKINYGMKMADALAIISEGNPGGLKALLGLMQHNGDHGFMLALDLDDMNMRGPQIWVAYKDYCECDIDKFSKSVRARDPKMVAYVNEEMGKEKFPHKAVTAGGSF